MFQPLKLIHEYKQQFTVPGEYFDITTSWISMSRYLFTEDWEPNTDLDQE
jgi:hypothetical protein